MGKDEYAYVIEYLPHGLMDSKDHKASAIILTDSLSLLVAATKKDVSLESEKKVYIGENKRDEIHHIIGRIKPEKLSGAGKERLAELISKRVKEEEQKFTTIINVLGPVNVRLNSLELIPNIGKKMTQKIIDERKKTAIFGL